MSAFMYVCSDLELNRWVPLTPAMLGGGGGGGGGLTGLQSAANSMSVVQALAAPVNRSGTITTANTAQQLMAANASRRGFWLLNLSTTTDLWINDLGAAAASQPSIKVPPGGLYESPLGGAPVSALSIFGSAAGLAFSSREW